MEGGRECEEEEGGVEIVCVDVCVLERREGRMGGGYPRGVETNKSLCRLCADTQLV